MEKVQMGPSNIVPAEGVPGQRAFQRRECTVYSNFHLVRHFTIFDIILLFAIIELFDFQLIRGFKFRF